MVIKNLFLIQKMTKQYKNIKTIKGQTKNSHLASETIKVFLKSRDTVPLKVSDVSGILILKLYCIHKIWNKLGRGRQRQRQISHYSGNLNFGRLSELQYISKLNLNIQV